MQLKPKKASFKHRCHVRIWSKWRRIFNLFWWTGTLLHRKWSERTYLRDKQFKRNIQVMVQEIAPWNLSDAWRRNRITITWTRTAILLIFTDRIESLRSEAQLIAGKKIFNVCQFKLSSYTLAVGRKWKLVLLEADHQQNGKFSLHGLREKLFDHDYSTGLCRSKTLTAMKRWIPFVFWSSARISTR